MKNKLHRRLAIANRQVEAWVSDSDSDESDQDDLKV